MMVAMVMVPAGAIPTGSAAITSASLAPPSTTSAPAPVTGVAAAATGRRPGRSATTLVTTAGRRLRHGPKLKHDQQVFAGGHDLRREGLIARNGAQPRARRSAP